MTKNSNSSVKHPGRPKGADNIERPVAVAVAARCPKCQGTAHRVKLGQGPVVHAIAGVSKVTGESYRFVVYHNVICTARNCGQHFRVREETNHDPRKA